LQLRLLEVRRELERLMASLAAERAIHEERREFIEVAEAMLAAAARGQRYCIHAPRSALQQPDRYGGAP
jgi:DNA-binding FadR family transcriptional regulator